MSDSQARQKILIVDDDPSLLEALERALRDAGEDVLAHGSFEDARRALRSDAEHIGAIYLVKPVTSSQLLEILRRVPGN